MENAKFFNLDKKMESFVDLLSEHNKTQKGYVLKINDLELKVHMGFLYHEKENLDYIFWGNYVRNQQENILTKEAPMFELSKIEKIEEVNNCSDLFSSCSVKKAFNLYMLPKNGIMDDCRSVVVGFIG